VPLAFGIALTAGAILEGKLGAILVAVMVFLLIGIGLKWLRKRLRSDTKMAAMSDELTTETTRISRKKEVR